MPAIDLEHRAWDTQHFGYPVASISNSGLEPEAVERVLRDAHKQGYQLVYWASRREHNDNAVWFRQYQGILVDRKTTYVKPLRPAITNNNSDSYRFLEWNPEQHSPELIELGVAAGIWSRFCVDPRIPRDKFRSLFEIWMRRSLARELSDMVLVVQEQGSTVPLGMVTISIKQGIGQIGLIAVSEQLRGHGLGRLLVDTADRWMLEHGAHSAQVVTQRQNVAACRLYEQAGYQVEGVEYFYHFWLPARVQAIRA